MQEPATRNIVEFEARSLLMLCRAGFEGDAAAEVMAIAEDTAGVAGYCETRSGTGWLQFHAVTGSINTLLNARPDWRDWVFTRQCISLITRIDQLPPGDRVAAILEQLPDSPREFAGLQIDFPDTNDGKSLSRFCRSFAGPMRKGLAQAGHGLGNGASAALHLFFVDSATVFLGLGRPGVTCPWPAGIPRLKMPRAAPSRSTLKLEEALKVFLSPEEQLARIRPGRHAVDLGAAPGGWTWQLTQRGMRVRAVDNGLMDAQLMETGLVDHVRGDAFRYRPSRPVDLMVCDVVEQPMRIARLMGQWFARGDCREAIFNLKLPMKRRYQHVLDCLEAFHAAANGESSAISVRTRQLYHDREEVTVHARVTRRG